MFRSNPRIGQELMDVPMGEMIREMAFSIAEAQMKLDTNSMEVAEMMGGLKTITTEIVNDQGQKEEKITFEDSRVFFGQEKVLTKDAVELHNTSTDQRYRTEVRRELGDGNFVYLDTKIAASGVTAVPTTQAKDGDDNALTYYVIGETWYEWDETAEPKKYKTLSEAPLDIEIELADGIKRDSAIYMSQRLSMLELGFAPTFYQFVDTVIQCAITIKFTREGSSSVSYSRKTESKNRSGSFGFRRGYRSNKTVTTSQVNANYSQKFSYSAEGSSLLRTKLVPIPPPAILEERIQQQMEIARERSNA